jgi:hypothetical protein
MIRNRVKGEVIHITQSGKDVEVWISSPTGDASDSHIFNIPCTNEHQAELVKEMWCETWGLTNFPQV